MHKKLFLTTMRGSRSILRDYARDQIPVVSVEDDDDTDDNKSEDKSFNTSISNMTHKFRKLNKHSSSSRHRHSKDNNNRSNNSNTHTTRYANNIIPNRNSNIHITDGTPLEHSSRINLIRNNNNNSKQNNGMGMGVGMGIGGVTTLTESENENENETENDYLKQEEQHQHQQEQQRRLTSQNSNSSLLSLDTSNNTNTTNNANINNNTTTIDSSRSIKSPSITTNTIDTIKLPSEVKQGVKHRARIFGGVIRGFGNFALFAITLLQILDVIGVPTNSLLIGTTLIGFSIALGFYNIISDFACGLFILAENQYFKGENVIINGICGIVESQSLRLTTIRSKDGRLHMFANGNIRKVTNCSREFALAVVLITIPYKTENDYIIAKQCLENVVSRAIKLDKSIDIISYLQDPIVEGIDQMYKNLIEIRYSIKVHAGTETEVQQAIMKHVRIEFIKNNIFIEKLQIPKMQHT